jgi:hypothetical protein
MSGLVATIEGIGYWFNGLPSWPAARDYVRTGTLPADAPSRPSPQLLAPNERRRAPETVAVALEVALAACTAADRDPKTLSSVFASTHGDLAITDYMCATLAEAPHTISPTRFHNSVHNAAAGYWTIGAGCMQATTALSAGDATFAEGLLEALAQLADGNEAVLLVGYDNASVGALRSVNTGTGLLGAALVLSRQPRAHESQLRATLVDAHAPPPTGALARLAAGNAMLPMLSLFEAVAQRGDFALLHAGPGRALRLELSHD